MNIQKYNYWFRIYFSFFFLILSSQILLSQSLLYYTVDPNVVYYGDEDTKLTIEVYTSGQDINRVYFYAPVEADLYDDGTHGDKGAGDGIYTLNDINPTDAYQTNSMIIGGRKYSTNRAGFDVKVVKNDFTEETDWVTFGWVDPALQFETTQLANNIYATQYALFIVDENGDSFDITDWPLGNVRCGKENFEVTQQLYTILPDSFDFIITMPAHNIYKPDNYAENVPYFVRAKNEIQNIGIDIFDNTSDFGSAGRLMGTIYHSWSSYGAILDHEIGHAWMADIGESLGLTRGEDSGYTNHWNKYSDIGGQMASFYRHPNAFLGAGHFIDNGNGTWRIDRDPANMPYSMLDLYCMGLVPKEDVPPIHILQDINDTDHLAVTAGTVETITIDDIIAAEGGERIPLAADSQNKFNVAFVVVKHKEFTDADYAFYSYISKYFASEELGHDSITPFFQATGGRGSLDPTLHIAGLSTKNETSIDDFHLSQNFPNPFNPATNLTFQIPRSGKIIIKVYNIRGEEIRTLINQSYPTGNYTTTWDGIDNYGNSVAAGLYFYQMEFENFAKTKKCLLIK